LLDQPQIISLHQLKTAIKVRLDPAIEVGEALPHHPPAIAQMSINRKRISILNRSMTMNSKVCSRLTCDRLDPRPHMLVKWCSGKPIAILGRRKIIGRDAVLELLSFAIRIPKSGSVRQRDMPG
jgi:hypothetical protein